jgi:hypothetical protein
MIRRLLYRYTAGRPCRLISRDGESRYLERYYVGQLLGLTVYLHRFVAEDADEEVHDHPFRALALCLAGGYEEERAVLCGRTGWQDRRRRMRPGRINFIDLRTFHRIHRTRPETWTLFVHGPRRKGWGFLKPIFDDDLFVSGVLYHQPLPPSDPEWWRTAPLGRDAGREPMA